MIEPRAWRRSLAIWCVIALGVRVQQIASEPAFVHPDAIYQAITPAVHAVWGFGELAWEFREGARSWAWPGLLAIVVATCKALGLAGPGIGMGPTIAAIRGLCALIDVTTLALCARFAWRRSGAAAAWGVVLVLALHPALAVTGNQPIIELPAALALAWGCEHVLAHDRFSRAHALRVGIALALTAMLRIHLAPAIAVLAIAMVIRTRRGHLRWEEGARIRMWIGALAVLLAFGVLDVFTWGAPFHALRTYLAFALSGGAERFGTMPVDRYWRDLGLALPGLGIALLAFAGSAARREPWLVAVIAAIVLPHQLLEHRAWRFLHPALPLVVLAAAIGIDALLRRLRRPRPIAIAAGLAVSAAIVLAWLRGAPWETTWLFDRGGWSAIERARGLDRAMVALSRRDAPHVVVEAVLPGAGSPGLALLGHDAELLYVLDERPPPATLARVDAWIVGPEQAVPDDLQLVYEDPRSGVRVVVR